MCLAVASRNGWLATSSHPTFARRSRNLCWLKSPSMIYGPFPHGAISWLAAYKSSVLVLLPVFCADPWTIKAVCKQGVRAWRGVSVCVLCAARDVCRYIHDV